MITLGVNIAILKEGKVLLTQREDFEVWCLPGGAVDENESIAAAALREAREETGLQVELKHLVGVYSQPNWLNSHHALVFAAQATGGEPRPQSNEVLAMDYFSQQCLPEPILFGQRQRILDALSNAHGVVRNRTQEWPFGKISRRELYALRDDSGLSRQEFYLKYFGNSDAFPDQLEVGPLDSVWE
jgi:ADP-ribose pyrophosphatase YjhB (NUDIX family)